MSLFCKNYPFIFVLGAILGIVTGYRMDQPVLLCIGLCISLVFVIVYQYTQKQMGAVHAVLFFFLFAVYTFLRIQTPAIDGNAAQFQGTVYGAVRTTEHRTKFVISNIQKEGQALQGKAYISVRNSVLGDMKLQNGMQISFVGKEYAPSRPNSKYAFDFFGYLKQQNIAHGIANIKNIQVLSKNDMGDRAYQVRQTLQAIFAEHMGKENAALASSLLFSHKSADAEELRELFQNLGIAHLFAVSGLHISILAGALFALLKRLSVPKVYRVVLTSVFMLAYAWLCGFSVATQRAFFMFVLLHGANLCKRPSQSLVALAWSAILILLINPFALFTAGFAFSFGAVLGILLIGKVFAKYISNFMWQHFRYRHWVQQGIQAFSMVLGAQVGVLLPTMYYFGSISLLALPMNLLIIPIIAIVLPLLLLCTISAYIPFVNTVLFGIAKYSIQVLLYFLKLVPASINLSLPMLSNVQSMLLVIFLGLLLPGFVRTNKKIKGILLCVTVFAFALHSALVHNPYPVYTQLSVGRADCAVLEDGNSTVVIDTGETGYELVNFLKSKNKSIDALYISHFDLDHYGGVEALLKNKIAIKKVYIPYGALYAENGEAAKACVEALQLKGVVVEEVGKGISHTYNRTTIEVLFPYTRQNTLQRKSNDTSLAMLLNIMDNRLLTMGDLPSNYELYAAQNCDIIKIAHHGSYTSTGAAFLHMVQPEVALISANGADGFPHPDVVQNLQNENLQIYNTANVGDIELCFKNKEYKVQFSWINEIFY